MAGLAPCPPAARPTPAQLALAKAKAKPFLVPKAKSKQPMSHLQEQKRRMEWVRLYKAAEEDVNSLGQGASKVAKKDDGFDGSGTPDPFNQNDADQGDEAEEGRKGVWGISDEEDDDSLVQGDGFNQNDDYQGEEDPEGWAEMARAVPTSFLLNELAQRCTR
jgi:hypothetical protein